MFEVLRNRNVRYQETIQQVEHRTTNNNVTGLILAFSNFFILFLFLVKMKKVAQLSITLILTYVVNHDSEVIFKLSSFFDSGAPL